MVCIYLIKDLEKILVPKHYSTSDALIEDAFRALLNMKPELKIEMAIELYSKEEVSLSRATEIADVDIESFKDILKSRGLKLKSYTGSEEDIEKGLRLI